MFYIDYMLIPIRSVLPDDYGKKNENNYWYLG